MIKKWICMPYGILVITIASYVLSVVPEYLSSYSMWYSSFKHYVILEYALIFGFYGGVITGLLLDILNQRIIFIAAAVLSLVSYALIPQFDGSTRVKQEKWQLYVLLASVFLVGQSSSMAILSTLKVNLKNFSITTSPIILSILLSYLYINEHIEGSIRWSFFFGLDNKIYLYGVAVTTSIIYFIAAFIMTVDEGQQNLGTTPEYQLATLDKVGLSVFVIYEIFMILLLLLFKLVMKDMSISTWIWVLLLAGNFVIPIINAEFILSRASDFLVGFDPDINDLEKLQKGKDKEIFATLKSWKLLTLFIVSVIMIGAGSLVYEKLTKVSIAISMSYLAEYAMIWYIFGNFVTRLLIGTTFTLLNYINDFIYLIFFGVEVFIALLLILLTPDHSLFIFNIAWFIGGSGIGGLYIMIPVILVQDYGKNYFGFIWGTFTTGIQAGILLFNVYVFDHYYDKFHTDRWGRCTSPQCFKSSFIIAGVSSLIGLLLIVVLWYMDRHDTIEGRAERHKLFEGEEKSNEQ